MPSVSSEFGTWRVTTIQLSGRSWLAGTADPPAKGSVFTVARSASSRA